MRALTAVIAALSFLALASPAAARPWTDPNGRLTLDLPAGWEVDPLNCPDCTYVLIFNPSRDCHVVARPRAAANALQPQRVRAIMRDNTRITPQIWTSGANAVPALFPGDSAQFVSQTVETERFWPMQRAELRSGERVVHGAMQLRPAMELWAFCVPASGAHSASEYNALFRSMGTPNDAQLQSEVEAAEAAAPATAPAPAPADQKQKERRRDRD
jgi:hypothetical protein